VNAGVFGVNAGGSGVNAGGSGVNASKEAPGSASPRTPPFGISRAALRNGIPMPSLPSVPRVSSLLAQLDAIEKALLGQIVRSKKANHDSSLDGALKIINGLYRHLFVAPYKKKKVDAIEKALLGQIVRSKKANHDSPDGAL